MEDSPAFHTPLAQEAEEEAFEPLAPKVAPVAQMVLPPDPPSPTPLQPPVEAPRGVPALYNHYLAMSREDLAKRIAGYESGAIALPADRRRVRTKNDYGYLYNLVELRGATVCVHNAYTYKIDFEEFFEPGSVADLATRFVPTEAERSGVYHYISMHARDGTLPGESEAGCSRGMCLAIQMIMIVHCLGVRACPKGLTKPRGLRRKTLFDVMGEVLMEGRTGGNSEAIRTIEQADGALFRFCHGRVYTEESMQGVLLHIRGALPVLKHWLAGVLGIVGLV